MIRRLLLLATLVAVVAPSTASAAFQRIDGSPIDVYVGDSGRLQARYDGQTAGEFFPSSSDEANAGFSLGTDLGQSPTLYGYAGAGFTPVTQTPVTGSGAAADPFQVVTVYSAPVSSQSQQQPPGRISVRQVVTYVNGQSAFRVRTELTSTGQTNVTFRPQMGADLTPGGSDSGFGYLAGGAPARTVGGFNPSSSGAALIGEVTPWRSYQAEHYTTVNTALRDLAGNGLTNAVSGVFVDIGTGAQWPDVTLCGCGTSTAAYEADWRFTRFAGLSLEPENAERAVGDTHTLTVKSQSPEGGPGGGSTIHYTVNGSNSTTGSVVTGPDGSAAISYTGANAGNDFITAFADLNGDGTQSSGEPAATAQVEWIAPIPGSTVALTPVRGTVLVKLPRGASPIAAGFRGAKARKAQAGGFVPLSQVASVPVKSQIDVARGEVRLTSAANLQGLVQHSNFYSGRFQVLQQPSRRPITELRMTGGSFRSCRVSKRSSANDPDALAAASRGKRVRRLWGNGKGRFRTRGRYSSATVRGTTWLVQDHCGGTLTRVARSPRTNRVVVRDFARKRNVTVRAGRSYFARPRAR
ncbi:MAG TPA: hypothetical protein VNT32_05080 [Thermoleophilaceae bacterium]|nr:hypothetical protein [Thermoleophilaceae bacterium]